MNVTTALFRLYRPIYSWFAAILITVEVLVAGLVLLAGPMRFSLWLTLAGSAAKYWLLVVGIMLVVTQFRTFVANGVTRHEFLAGAALFALTMTVGFAVVVVAGHAAESLALGLTDNRDGNYPVFVGADVFREFGAVAPVSLAYLVSGALIAAGFHRFRPLVGVALIVPGAIPMAVAAVALGLNEFGEETGRMPYLSGLLLTLAVVVLGAAACHRVLRDVAIRRTTD
ncbi:MAG: hypothetical protein ABW046_06675 [Actinoplanes sp.]